jgi:hypothetical protein
MVHVLDWGLKLKITSFLVFEEAPLILMISIGLETGYIYCIRGDVARERIVRTKLQVDESSNGSRSPVIGLGFRVEGPTLQLFVVTTISVSLFDMHHQPPRRHILDQIGCGSNSVSMSDNQVIHLHSFVLLIVKFFLNSR